MEKRKDYSPHKIKAIQETGGVYLTEFRLPLSKNDVVDILAWTMEKLGLTEKLAREKISSSPELKSAYNHTWISIVPPETLEVHKGLSDMVDPVSSEEKRLNLAFVPAKAPKVISEVLMSDRPMEKKVSLEKKDIERISSEESVIDMSSLKKIQNEGIKHRTKVELEAMSVSDLNALLELWGANSANVIPEWDSALQKNVRRSISKKEKIQKILQLQEARYGREEPRKEPIDNSTR